MARPPYCAVFFSSLAVLAFEVFLVRIFTIRFSYHYAALIISISMLGLVLGGLAVFARYGKTGKPLTASLVPVSLLSLSLPLTFIVSTVLPFDYYRLLWDNRQIIYIGASFFLFALPFFFSGFFITLTLARNRDRANTIYAADLCGAATGVITAILCLNAMPVQYAVALLSLLLTGIVVATRRRTPASVYVAILSIPLCIAIFAGFAPLSMSPYKGLIQAMKDEGAKKLATVNTEDAQLDLFQSPRMKYAPGLSLTYSKPIPVGPGIALDGDISGTFPAEKITPDLMFLEYMTASLPYVITERPGAVLVCGMHTGTNTLMPHYFGAGPVYTTEINRSIILAVRNHTDRDGIYRKSLTPMPPRGFLSLSGRSFDIISIARTPFFPGSAFGLQEDYGLTTEALGEYLSSLTDRGVLFVQLFVLPPPRLDLRLFGTITAALRRRGLTDYKDHLIVYRSWETMNFVVSRRPFQDSTRVKVTSFLKTMQFDQLYPVPDNGMEITIVGTDYRGLFEKIANGKARQKFFDAYPFDIRPVTDDRPFFHYVMKPGQVRQIYAMTGKKWVFFLYEGMALPFLLLLVVFTVLVVFLFILFHWGRTAGQFHLVRSWHIVLYFTVIGFGFMFVEIYCIHKLVLPFGSPVIAFSVAVVTLLVSSGIGSMVTGLLRKEPANRLTALLPLFLVSYVSLLSLAGTTGWSLFLLLPVGFLLGILFPAGIRTLAGKNEKAVALGYTANGAASVIAPPLASLIAVQYGCTILLLAAAALYGVSSALLCFTRHGYKSDTA